MEAVPTAAELIEAVAECLRDELLPALAGRAAFQARVAIGVLEIARRELRDGPAADAAERARLLALRAGGAGGPASVPTFPEAAVAFAGVDGSDRTEAGGAGCDPATLRRALADAIRDGSLDIDRPDLRAHLWADVLARVAIDQPVYPSFVDETRGDTGRT